MSGHRRPDAWTRRADAYKAARIKAGTCACFYWPAIACFPYAPPYGLHVHHLRYSEYGTEPDEDLELLCGYHHDRVHDWAQAYGIGEGKAVSKHLLELYREVVELEDRIGNSFRESIP